jgi:hypothetical protein
MAAALLALVAAPAIAAGPPSVNEVWTSSVARTQVTLKARIDPEELATTLHIEYGTTNAYGEQTGESGVGSDGADHLVSVFLAGLQPGTTYHWRAVATNGAGVTEGSDREFTTYPPASVENDCVNQVFRIGPAAHLPDCRAYEMVSPMEKNNGDIAWFNESPNSADSVYTQSSLDGEKVTYSSSKAFGDAVSAPYTSQYIATRHADQGWSTHSINPPERKSIVLGIGYVDREYKAFSPDLSIGWLAPESGIALAPGAAEGHVNLYRRDNLTDSYQALTIGPRTASPFTGYRVGFQGASADGTHALFVANERLTPDAAPMSGEEHYQLYEWVNGGLRLVSILPNGEPYSGFSAAGGPAFIPALTGRNANLQHAISENGSRVFWTTTDIFGSFGQIYVRIDGAETVPVSESVSNGPAAFWLASADGSKAVFSLGNQGTGALYEFDVDTETPTLIAGSNVGVIGASEDASYLYFASEEALAAGATAGEQNIYLYHAGAITFIATPTAGESPSPFASQPIIRTSRVSPDGRHIVFMSKTSLTGYDNVDAESGLAVSEVYRYDADSAELSCVSCNPSGARPSDSQNMPNGPFNVFSLKVAAWIPVWQSSFYTARSIADGGNRIFFNSFDALVPEDSNGQQDVYQWEAPGTGRCTEGSPAFSTQNDGCISLISSGESTEASLFLDASPDGQDVFFTTKSSLVSQDPGLVDLYDARAGGGFASPPPPPPPCFGDACQGASQPPSDQTPASASFRGEGNPAPRKAKRHCRAARRHAARAKGHAKSKRNAKRCTRNNRRAGR